MGTEELIWSFISNIERIDPGKDIEASFSFQKDRLARLGASEELDSVPEGLLIECCAQASGFILFAEIEELTFVPVLARVSEAEFFLPLEVGREARAVCEKVHRSENGAEFECSVRALETDEIVARCRLLLGFTPLDRVGDGGEGIKSHFLLLKRQLQLA